MPNTAEETCWVLSDGRAAAVPPLFSLISGFLLEPWGRADGYLPSSPSESLRVIYYYGGLDEHHECRIRTLQSRGQAGHECRLRPLT